MKRAKHLMSVILAIGSCLFAGCGRHHEAAQSNSSATNPSTQAPSGQDTNQSDNWHWDQAKADALLYKADHENDTAAALAYAAMIREKTLHNPPSNEVPLPNYQAGPLNPSPIHINFYGLAEHYPAYLLCAYDVDENHYDQANESRWFKAALSQIRNLGAQKFPPFRWVAIVIKNRAENKDASTFEQSFKVGAIFNASDLFDQSRDLQQLVAQAEMDRHPFKYDQQGEPQQRWVIVERHAATNHPTAGSN